MAGAERREIRAIDGLRGVAALGIVIYHGRSSLAYAPELAFAAGAFEKYYLLLDLFFVVSGYAIASGYGGMFTARVTAADYGRFLWGRIPRLYPLYLFVLLLLVAQEFFFLWSRASGLWDPGYMPFERPFANPGNLATSLVLLQAWGIHDKLVWNVPAWYVSALMGAYLAFPFIARAASGLPARLRGVVLIGLAGTATLALHAAYQINAFPPPFDLAPLRAVLEFTIGYGLAQLAPLPAWRRHLQVPLLALAMASLHLGWRDEMSVLLLIAFFWSLLDDRGVVAAVLGSAPLVWLGGASYGIFLVHQPMLSLFDGLNNTPLSRSLWLLWSEYFTWNLALRLVLVVLAGWLAQRLIADPARRWLQRRTATGARRA
ncbi:MAG: acyltransferase [Alphaproteobacteria bacterium]|nr:acyltransferase [Alphaproteobacteria bacterium]